MRKKTPNSVVMTERIFVSLMDVRFAGKSHRSLYLGMLKSTVRIHKTMKRRKLC